MTPTCVVCGRGDGYNLAHFEGHQGRYGHFHLSCLPNVGGELNRRKAGTR